MREIKFRALMHSRGLDKYFVSDGLGIDSGLSCLFGFENEGLDKLNNVVLCSQKFIKEVKEDWWESDWVHTDNLQYTGLKDKNGVEIYEGDIVKGSAYGKEIYTGVVEFYDASFVMRIDGNKGYYRLNKMTFQELEVIGNIYEHNIQEKYNLDGDKEDVQKAIKLIRELENRTCDSCWFYDDDCKVCTNDSVFGMDEDLKRTGAFSTLPNFSCNRWEQK